MGAFIEYEFPNLSYLGLFVELIYKDFRHSSE